MTEQVHPESDGSFTDVPAPPKQASRLEDFIDIFYAPSDVFARREKSGFGIPMLVVTVIIGVLAIVNSGAIDAMMEGEFARAAARNPNGPQMTAEQMAGMRKITSTMTQVGTFFILPAVMFILGLFLWVFGKFVGATQTLAAALVVSCYSYMPRVVEAVINCVQALLIDTSTITSRTQFMFGPARFMDPDTASPVAVALASRVDLFTIWVTVLLAIGLAVTGRIPLRKAAIAGVLMWVFGSLPVVLPALMQSGR